MNISAERTLTLVSEAIADNNDNPHVQQKYILISKIIQNLPHDQIEKFLVELSHNSLYFTSSTLALLPFPGSLNIPFVVVHPFDNHACDIELHLTDEKSVELISHQRCEQLQDALSCLNGYLQRIV